MFPITCNAIGDILAVASLILSIAKALDESRGAPAEYRAFVAELHSLGHLLNSIYRVTDGCADAELRRQIVKEVASTATDIHSALDKVAVFNSLSDLQADDSSDRRSDAGIPSSFRFERQWVKVKWRLFQHSKVVKVIGELAACRQKLLLQLMAAQLNESIGVRTDIVVVADKLSEVQTNIHDMGMDLRTEAQVTRSEVNMTATQLVSTTTSTLAELREITSKATGRIENSVNSLVTAFNSIRNSSEISPTERHHGRHQAVSIYRLAESTGMGGLEDNAAIVCAIAVTVSTIDTLHVRFRTAFLYAAIFMLWRIICKMQRLIAPSPGYSPANAIILIDVLNTRILLPIDACETWDVFHETMLRLFSNKPGHSFVRERAYEITDTESSLVLRTGNWLDKIKHGMELEMAIVVKQEQEATICPWCNTKTYWTATADRTEVTCLSISCGRSFHTSLAELNPGGGEKIEMDNNNHEGEETQIPGRILKTSQKHDRGLLNNPFRAKSYSAHVATTNELLPENMSIFRKIHVCFHKNGVDMRISVGQPQSPAIPWNKQRRLAMLDLIPPNLMVHLEGNKREDGEADSESVAESVDIWVEPPSRPSSTTPPISVITDYALEYDRSLLTSEYAHRGLPSRPYDGREETRSPLVYAHRALDADF